MQTLLLADESVNVQRLVELIFADRDVDVVAVADGEEAIRQVEAAPPDIVLADAGMAGRDGYEVARYVKQHAHLAHIPVVLLAGAFEAVDRERARAAGCAGILAKPLEPQLVISRVQELLAARPRGPSDLGGSLEVRNGGDVPAAPDEAANETAAGDRAAHVQELDAYFANLDAAFADRLQTPPGSQPSPAPDEGANPEAAGLSEPPAASTLADTFAALLAGGVEQRNVDPAPPTAVTTDEIVDQVSRRVLAHLTDHAVRETVREIVPAIAERLVREEIERIKASIR